MEGDLTGRLILTTADAFDATAAAFLAQALREPLASGRDGTASLALSGGSTPGPVYERLARASELDWDRVDVFFADERGVPPDDPRSNYGLARRTLLDPAGVPARRVHRMEAERSDREAAAGEYAALLPDRLDVLVLGVGEDGHTASLFPGSALLEGPDRHAAAPAVAPVEAPPGHEVAARMSVSPEVVLAARQLVVLARGERKAEPVRRALEEEGSPREVPARLAREGTWILDREASSRLSSTA